MSALAMSRPGKLEAPKPRLLQSIPLRFIKRRGHAPKAISQELPLVPFVDFLITLVVFLLMSFSTSGEIRASDTIRLPSATHGVDLEQAPVLTVDRAAVLLDGRRVLATADLGTRAEASPEPRLVEALEREAQSCRQLRRRCPGLVLLAVDRDTDMRMVRRVVVSAAAAGYPNVGFAVDRR